jgi:hypothetical protein
MKVAVCVSGQPREFKRSYPSLKAHILNHVDADIFIYTWNALKQPHFEVEGAIRYPDEGPIQEFLSLYDPVAAVVEEWSDATEKYFYDAKYEANRHPHASIVRYRAMLYTIYQCNALKNRFEKENDIKYDIVIKARSDIELTRPVSLDELEFAKSQNILFSDVCRGDGMVSDILWFGNPHVMDAACNLWKDFDNYYNQGVQFNTEVMFPHHLRSNGFFAREHSIGNVSVLRPPQVVW